VIRYALLALRILFSLMRMRRADAHLIKLIDATPKKPTTTAKN